MFILFYHIQRYLALLSISVIMGQSGQKMCIQVEQEQALSKLQSEVTKLKEQQSQTQDYEDVQIELFTAKQEATDLEEFITGNNLTLFSTTLNFWSLSTARS